MSLETEAALWSRARVSESAGLLRAPLGPGRVMVAVEPTSVDGSRPIVTPSNHMRRPAAVLEPVPRRPPTSAGNVGTAAGAAARLPRLHRGPSGRRSRPDVLARVVEPAADSRSAPRHSSVNGDVDRAGSAGTRPSNDRRGAAGPDAGTKRRGVPTHSEPDPVDHVRGPADHRPADAGRVDPDPAGRCRFAIDLSLIGAVVSGRHLDVGLPGRRTVRGREDLETTGSHPSAPAARPVIPARFPRPRSIETEPARQRGHGRTTTGEAADEGSR
ncbi:hypothetical protein FHR81_003468 [Actinoalloteichus hoggarensis]|uniref:Uncharacterized protein n=1 Tax=Actinoalloteichus hoggarensis TaxID=1470176 RepID=A0A221W7D5_9PSEU|nr:hypothetical protein AHOG_21010 [Actinoalloteichus hoggarensis]MBB5922416.1 hypothetical protein [Actinoalloteichus hoggarensis]